VCPARCACLRFKCVTCRKDRCQLAENTERLYSNHVLLSVASHLLCAEREGLTAPGTSLGNDNRAFVEIPPRCSKTGALTQGKQKEPFPALKNNSRIAEVGNKTSQSCTEFEKKKRKSTNDGFSVVQTNRQ